MTGLPVELGTAIDSLLEGQRHGRLAQRAQQISAKYRANAPSAQAIGEMSDAVAYALSRMPATYAAVATVLGELQARAPAFRVRTLLDAGAGPGTAAWATAETFPEMEAATLLDTNPASCRQQVLDHPGEMRRRRSQASRYCQAGRGGLQARPQERLGQRALST